MEKKQIEILKSELEEKKKIVEKQKGGVIVILIICIVNVVFACMFLGMIGTFFVGICYAIAFYMNNKKIEDAQKRIKEIEFQLAGIKE